MSIFARGLLLLLAAQLASALYVTDKSSPCYEICNGNDTVTTTSDLVCDDAQFSSTTRGRVYQDCLECQSTSFYWRNETLSDQYYYILHMKFLQDFCMVDDEEVLLKSVESCGTECAPLARTLDLAYLTSPRREQYFYCDVYDDSYMAYGPACGSCLQGRNGTVVIGNMVQIMANACADRPTVTQGQLVDTMRGFNTSIVETETPSPTADPSPSTTPSPSPPPSPSPSPPPQPTTSPEPTTLSVGVQAGIGVSAAVAGVAIIAALAYWIRRRNRKRSIAKEVHMPDSVAWAPGNGPVEAADSEGMLKHHGSPSTGYTYEAPSETTPVPQELPAAGDRSPVEMEGSQPFTDSRRLRPP